MASTANRKASPGLMNISISTVSRRNFLGVMAAVGGGAVLAGCTSPDPRGGGTSSTGKVVMWTYLNDKDPRGISEREILAPFATKNGIDLEYNVVPWNQLDPNLITARAGGNQPDISRSLHSFLGLQFTAKTLSPLDDYISKTFSDEEMKQFPIRYDVEGRTMAMLVDNQQTALLLRADWLDKLNRKAPKTWDELVDLGKEMQGLNKGVTGYGIYASATQLNHDQFLFQPQIHGRGGKLLNAEGRAVYNDDIGVEVFQFYRDLVHKHGVAPASTVNDTYENTFEGFKAGRTGMSMQPSNRFNNIFTDIGQENVLIAPIPGPTEAAYSPAPSMGWAFVIPAGARNPDEAWKIIAERLSKESQLKFSKDTLNLPTSLSLLDDPFFSTPGAAAIRAFAEIQRDHGEKLSLAADGNAFNLGLANALQEVISNPSAPIKPILDRAVETYNSIL